MKDTCESRMHPPNAMLTMRSSEFGHERFRVMSGCNRVKRMKSVRKVKQRPWCSRAQEWTRTRQMQHKDKIYIQGHPGADSEALEKVRIMICIMSNYEYEYNKKNKGECAPTHTSGSLKRMCDASRLDTDAKIYGSTIGVWKMVVWDCVIQIFIPVHKWCVA